MPLKSLNYRLAMALSLVEICCSQAAISQSAYKQVWYKERTSTGCVFFVSTSPERVAIEKRQNKYYWDGENCTPGAPIYGNGTLRTETIENGKPWIEFSQGRMENGIFVGTQVWWTSFFPDKRNSEEMIGGCYKENYISRGCQPR